MLCQQSQTWESIFALIYFIIFSSLKNMILWSRYSSVKHVTRNNTSLIIINKATETCFSKGELKRERDWLNKIEQDLSWKTSMCRNIALETPQNRTLNINTVSSIRNQTEINIKFSPDNSMFFQGGLSRWKANKYWQKMYIYKYFIKDSTHFVPYGKCTPMIIYYFK